jgi:hypothetical protein
LTLTKPGSNGVWRFGVEYLPKNYLRVCRMGTDWKPIKDSSRTIYETFGFFQMSFLKALQAFDIGKRHWEQIEANKADRDNFTRMTQEIRRYNEIECELLAELMEAFRDMCFATDLRPKTWNGSGKLAAAEHARNGTMTGIQVKMRTPSGVLQFASDAYYGGRFEVPYVGDIPGPIYEYDRRSAYPAAMRELPCLKHGRWRYFIGSPGKFIRGLHVARVAFKHPANARLCGLPIRQADGRLFWPREGQGTYWSVELKAARKLGARIAYVDGWRYEHRCECQPFDWVEHRFEQRRAIAAENKAKGVPIKLALNSLYGKLAQRIGNPRYGNFVWAGLITAITRAALIEVACQAPDAITMFATDAVFSRVPLTLPVGEHLGEWEAHEHPRMFIVQPGLYWGPPKPKSRGVPASFFAEHTPAFEAAWRLWCAITPPDAPVPPACSIPVPAFVGLRLAHARGKPETAGKWIKKTDPEAMRQFSFAWDGKRAAAPEWITPTCVQTRAADGGPALVSKPHSGELLQAFDIDRLTWEDARDPLDLAPPGFSSERN